MAPKKQREFTPEGFSNEECNWSGVLYLKRLTYDEQMDFATRQMSGEELDKDGNPIVKEFHGAGAFKELKKQAGQLRELVVGVDVQNKVTGEKINNVEDALADGVLMPFAVEIVFAALPGLRMSGKPSPASDKP